ncbi:hypothetical protein Tco_0367622 [Tanacetum coccineum]
MEDTLRKFMSESAKRHEANSNLIKQIRATTDAAIRNQGALIKTLEIQIGQMSKGRSMGAKQGAGWIWYWREKVFIQVRLWTEELKMIMEDPKISHLEVVKHIFRYVKGTMHLGLWYPKGSDIETIVYADSDHAGDYVDPKSTSSIFTFMGCCLTSWFSKKQTALAISTTEAEYVSAGKACQQALWMK